MRYYDKLTKLSYFSNNPYFLYIMIYFDMIYVTMNDKKVWNMSGKPRALISKTCILYVICYFTQHIVIEPWICNERVFLFTRECDSSSDTIFIKIKKLIIIRNDILFYIIYTWLSFFDINDIIWTSNKAYQNIREIFYIHKSFLFLFEC